MHGDRVVARVVKVDRDGTPRGGAGRGHRAGRRRRWSGGCGARAASPSCVPTTRGFITMYSCLPDASTDARDGDYVVARVTEPPTGRHPPDRRSSRRCSGHRMLPGNGDRPSPSSAYELPVAWSEETVSEAAAVLPAGVRGARSWKAGRICAVSRSSPSTGRMRAISTTRFTANAAARGMAGGGGHRRRIRLRPPRHGAGRRKRGFAATPSTSPIE